MVDLLAVLIAGVTAYLVWALPVRGQSLETYFPALALLPVTIVGYAQAGLYPGFGLGPVETLRRYWLVITTMFFGLAALTFALRAPDRYSRMTLVIAFILTLALAPLGRKLARRFGASWTWWREPVVLIGAGRRTDLALSKLKSESDEFVAVGVLAPSASGATDDAHDPLPSLGSVHDAHLVAESGVRVAFVDLDRRGATSEFDDLRLVFPRILVLRELEKLPVEGVKIRNLGGVLGLEYSSDLLKLQSQWVKRATDVVLGTLLLVVALPVMLGTMLLVRVTDGGPIIYRQRREGKNGRTIDVPKIRTMVTDADDRLAALLQSDAGFRDQWDGAFKLEDDPRMIPGIGRILRRFSIDELPQLWSVLKGEMSLVGPRPFPRYHLEALSPQARQLRQRVRPGLTGMWQVTARGVADIKAQEKYDTYYIRNWSIWLDLYIIAHTFGAVLSGRGAH